MNKSDDWSLSKMLTNSPSDIIWLPFMNPSLDLDDRAYIDLFHQSLRSVQYSAAIAITGKIRGTSSEKIFKEMGLQNLNQNVR